MGAKMGGGGGGVGVTVRTSGIQRRRYLWSGVIKPTSPMRWVRLSLELRVRGTEDRKLPKEEQWAQKCRRRNELGLLAWIKNGCEIVSL